MGNTNFGRDYGATPTVNGAPISTSNPEPITGTVAQGAAGASAWKIAQPDAIGVAGTGELQGVIAATQMPTLACKYVRYKARLTNTGNVYIGLAGVTAPDGTTDATTGFSLTPGDDTGWIPITNTNLLYRICTGTGDALTFMALV